MPRLNRLLTATFVTGLVWLVLPSSPSAISPEDQLLAGATSVLLRVLDGDGASAIPIPVLMRSHAIAVFPRAQKDGLRYYATGVMSAREGRLNTWTPPAVLELEGALPLDLNNATVDFILVAQTRRGLDYLIQERFTSPVIVPISPGGLGENTDAQGRADLVAYIHFGDYFAGVTVNDWIISEAKAANARLYGWPCSTEDIAFGAILHLPPAARSWSNAVFRLFGEMS